MQVDRINGVGGGCFGCYQFHLALHGWEVIAILCVVSFVGNFDVSESIPNLLSPECIHLPVVSLSCR